MKRCWCAFVALAALTACSGKTTHDTLELDATLHSTLVDECGVALPAVLVCVDGRKEIPCVTSDALGIADLAIPLHQALVVSYSKQGFVEKLRHYVSNQEKNPGFGIFYLQPKAWYDAQTKTLSGPDGVIDYGLGMVSLASDPIEGLDLKIEPLEGQPAAIGPFQFANCANNGCPGPCLCVSGATCESGTAGFIDVPLGRWKGLFSKPGYACTPDGFACKDGTPGCVEFESRAGVLTGNYVHCAPG